MRYNSLRYILTKPPPKPPTPPAPSLLPPAIELTPVPIFNSTANLSPEPSTNRFPNTDGFGTSSPPRLLLPELPYSLRDHKRSVAIIWTLLALDGAIIPLALFYPLWYDTNLSPTYIFAITTASFGIISGIEWFYRSWSLWKKEELRPFVGKRNGFDFFHISHSTAYGIALVGTVLIQAHFLSSIVANQFAQVGRAHRWFCAS